MSEVKLPSYFEYKKEELGESDSDLLAFEYDSDAQEFRISETSIKLSEFDPYRYVPDVDAPEATAIPFDEMHEHPLMIPGFSGVIGSPKLHDWAAEHSATWREEVTEVMHKAFTSLVDEEFAREVKNEPAGFMGFDAGLREDGGLAFQVFGNCACMGVSQDGLFVYGGMQEGFGQYELHNADSQAQRASLYAGIGHLARLASKE